MCREHGISNATYYKWKSKSGGMEVSDIQRMKDLEAENRRRKQMFADLSLETPAPKDIIEKALKPVECKQLVSHMVNEHEMSIRRACAALKVIRSMPHPRDGSEVIAALTELEEKKLRWGLYEEVSLSPFIPSPDVMR